MGNLSRDEFNKKIRFKTIDSQEPSYAGGGRIMGTYASGGYKIVEVHFDGKLIATKRISFNPEFERTDEARLDAVSKNLWRRHGGRETKCDYEQYLPPHDKPCGEEAIASLLTNEGYELYFCSIHRNRGRAHAAGNNLCDADSPLVFLLAEEGSWRAGDSHSWRDTPSKGKADGRNWIGPARPRTENPGRADFDYIAVGYTVEDYEYSGPTPQGAFSYAHGRIKWQDEIVWDGEWYRGGYRAKVLHHARERGIAHNIVIAAPPHTATPG